MKRVEVPLLVTAALAWSMFHYHAIWRSPNGSMFGDRGDALKNYFTFAWHARSDTSITQFSGMNHPFGEQINYPDAQPLWSGMLWCISRSWPEAAHYAVGFENILMLLAPVLTALCALLLLREFGIGRWLASLCAFGAMALEPQMIRVVGHFGLSHGYAIPLVAWLYFRARRMRRPYQGTLVLGAAVLALQWTHPYLGFIPWCLIALTFLMDITLSWGHWRGRAFAVACALALPQVIFLLAQALTDHHVDRTTHPLGFFDHRTDLKMLTHSYWGMDSPLARWLLGGNEGLGFEGTSYLGLASLLMLPVSLVLLIIRALSASKRPLHGRARLLAPLILASVILLTYAMGYPFVWGLEVWVWKIPGVAQFRSVGRFAWPTFWVFELLAIVTVDHLCGIRKLKGLRWIGGGAMALVVALPIYEGYYHYRSVSEYIGAKPNLFNEAVLKGPDLAMVKAARRISGHVAVLPLPWFHYSSEEFLITCADGTQEHATLLSFHTGLPLMANVLPKVSLAETRMLINALGPPWYERPLAHHMDPNARILVLEQKVPLDPVDSMIVARSTTVADLNDRRLLSITVRDLLADEREILGDAIAPDGSMENAVLYESFDDRASVHSRHGTGALQLPSFEGRVISTLPPGSLIADRRYVATFWFFNRGPLRCLTTASIEDQDPITGSVSSNEWFDLRACRTIDGDWSMASFEFLAREVSHEYHLVLDRLPWLPDTLWVDELLVRPAGVPVDSVQRDDRNGISWIFHNGHWLKSP